MLKNKLEIKHLYKSYHNVNALNDINLVLEDGIYGLVGNNGAGKSSLLNILTTILPPTKGEVLYLGKSIQNNIDYRNVLGYVPQILDLPTHMSVEQYLFYVASLKGLNKKEAKKRIDLLLDRLNLTDKRNSLTSALSGGQKHRVLIIQSLLNNPKVIFMDEPTAGLDPIERRKLREFIVEISKDKIIVITTHVITDVEYIANQIIFMKHGSICEMGKQEDLLNQVEVFESEMTMEEYHEFSSHNKIVNIAISNNQVYVRHFNSNIPGRRVVTKLEDLYIKALDS